MKNSHSKLSENEPICMCKEGWCVGSGYEGGTLREDGGNTYNNIVWNTLKGGGIGKRGREAKILKRWGANLVKVWVP